MVLSDLQELLDLAFDVNALLYDEDQEPLRIPPPEYSSHGGLSLEECGGALEDTSADTGAPGWGTPAAQNSSGVGIGLGMQGGLLQGWDTNPAPINSATSGKASAFYNGGK